MAKSSWFFVTVLHASWMRYASCLSWCSASRRALVTVPVFAADCLPSVSGWSRVMSQSVIAVESRE
eukprot:7584541-Ditylum_brightwellii.AAC.1